MPTNKEWLFSLSLDELYAWFDAEHVDAQRDNNGTCPINNGTRLNMCNKSGENVTDSREKLEADVREWVDDIGWLSDKETQVADFIAWLDRQAAITERECREWQLNDLVGMTCGECESAQAAELKAKIAELQVELERMTDLYEYHKHNCDGWEESYDELSDENDRLNIELDKYRRLFDKNDDREKLEHDIHSWLTSQVAVTVYVTEIESEVRKWLDRQANMTAAVWSGYMADAAKQIDELHARLDHLPDERECEVCDRATMVEEINGLSAERDYWRDQVWKTLMCAGNYAPAVMAYPRPDSYTEPSTLVTDAINSLRDFHADDQRLIKKLEAEVESYRKKLSHAVDNAHDTVMLMDEGAA